MASTSNPIDASTSGSASEKDNAEPAQGAATLPSSNANPGETDVKARVDAVWEQMNKGISNKNFKDLLKKSQSNVNKTPKKASSDGWKAYLGLTPKTESRKDDLSQKGSIVVPNNTSDTIMQDSSGETSRKLAAAALVEVKDAGVAALGRGKIEIREVRDFAGQQIEVKKLVDADSKEASDKAKAHAPSAVDAVLEQIKKKPKLSVLDKTKKDWGEFKEEKGLDEELDAYKKSSNQYLDKVSFLERADYREFERERDARLAVQAKRRPDMREGP
ncbi:uncharacterized protein LOC126791020 [Argentina anserina]|uniref:uncharacterized protein LOC126791020 n=1 Tax=Argentina anserina TaxID=57926 RepID=UPI0021763EEC|nr:uncharacterized protein LOC126791020 [Potentilla anserina]